MARLQSICREAIVALLITDHAHRNRGAVELGAAFSSPQGTSILRCDLTGQARRGVPFREGAMRQYLKENDGHCPLYPHRSNAKAFDAAAHHSCLDDTRIA